VTHRKINPSGVVPVESDVDFAEPHRRAAAFAAEKPTQRVNEADYRRFRDRLPDLVGSATALRQALSLSSPGGSTSPCSIMASYQFE
jgi:hypothetical protein